MDSTLPYPSLLAPLTLAGHRLKNRVVHASMTTRFGVNRHVTDKLVQYHENRARGGAALIVTEPLSMARHQNIDYKIRAWNDDDLDGLTRWAAAVRAHNSHLVGQIQDSGRGRHAAGRNPDAVGAWALPDDISWTVPHALTVTEIEQMIADFAQSSARIQRCGFSGVEISAGHGHLFHQFMSPRSNARTDRYGGGWANRTRFVTEIIAAIRAACGAGFIIGIKLPGDDGAPHSIGPLEAAIVAQYITAARNVDYVCFAHGTHARSLELHVPDGHGPRAPYVPLMRDLRAAVNGVPVVALGRITDPAEADAILARGDAELIAMGRTLVCDPAWLAKAAHNRAHDIRYCVSCNSCWDTTSTQHAPIACDNNPRVGLQDEVDWWPLPAKVLKRVVVVGAGIAGMEAAWIAAARGHPVTVFGSSSEIGGKTRLRALLPGGEALSSIYDYQHAAAQKARARFELGLTASVADIIALKPDAVVLACGADMTRPLWLPRDLGDAGGVPDLRTAMADLLGITARQPGTAVIFDMDHTDGTYAAAEFLRARFERVVLLTPRDSIAQDVAMVTRQGILRRMHEQHIEMVLHAEPCALDALEDGTLVYANIYTQERMAIDDVAFFAYSTPRAPRIELFEPLRAAGIAVHVVGDCRVARGVMAATAEGHAAGNAV
jgi:2,4-dienoyl-CoA reductase-like NADH-dependent reductase (Old Yellow Enzyme family)